MRLLGPGSSGSSSGPLMAAITALVLVSGCSGADAALVDGECDQTINVAVPKLPTRAEKERRRKDICTPAYDRCIDAGGGSIEGRIWGETQCKACFEACMRYGSWPKEANDKPCPGA